jgi:hypothetical protein
MTARIKIFFSKILNTVGFGSVMTNEPGTRFAVIAAPQPSVLSCVLSFIILKLIFVINPVLTSLLSSQFLFDL